MRDWILAVPPEAIEGMFALGRQREVDAAVREGLKRWAEAWSCHPCDPELIPYVTGHGESHKAVPFIRQAWREQHR